MRWFVRFHDGRHPRSLDGAHLERFLSNLAVERKVAASTQNQALAALLFLYRDAFDLAIDISAETVRTRHRPRAPVVLTRAEVWRILGSFDVRTTVPALVATLLYGTGLRLGEALSLRVKGVDLAPGRAVGAGW